MFEKIAINMAISFVLKQLARFKTEIDWSKIEADLDVQLKKVIPGTAFDDEAMALLHSLLAAIKASLNNTSAIQDLLTVLAAGNWTAAAADLKTMISAAWSSGAVASTETQKELFASMS